MNIEVLYKITISCSSIHIIHNTYQGEKTCVRSQLRSPDVFPHSVWNKGDSWKWTTPLQGRGGGSESTGNASTNSDDSGDDGGVNGSRSGSRKCQLLRCNWRYAGWSGWGWVQMQRPMFTILIVRRKVCWFYSIIFVNTGGTIQLECGLHLARDACGKRSDMVPFSVNKLLDWPIFTTKYVPSIATEDIPRWVRLL